MEHETTKKSIEIRADDQLVVRVKVSRKKCSCGLPLIKVNGFQSNGSDVTYFICSEGGVFKENKLVPNH
jgi:hypothetical protein